LNDDPVRMEEINIELKNGVGENDLPRLRCHPMPNTHVDFAKKTMEKLERAGAVVKCSNPIAISPIVVVCENGVPKRLVVDQRTLNGKVQQYAWTVPHPEAAVKLLGKHRVWAKIDLKNGYWQIPLNRRSRRLFGISTPFGTYCSTRLLQGFISGTEIFQRVVDTVLDGLEKSWVSAYLDDIVVGAENWKELTERVQLVLGRLLAANLKVNWKKSTLAATTVNWCGRMLTSSGIGYDWRKVDPLKELKAPETVKQLQHLIHSFNWMRGGVANYALIVDPLLKLLEYYVKKIGSRKKRRLNIPLDTWEEIHERSFEDVKQALMKNTLLHPVETKNELVVSTDASDTHWAVVLSQCPTSEMEKVVQDQVHEPVLFLSGTFKGSQLHWSTWEKELFPITQVIKTYSYLLHREKGFTWYTDSQNVRYMFAPDAKRSGNRVLLDKVIRWAIALSSFQYKILHVPGETNFWCDMLSRFGHPGYTKKREEKNLEMDPEIAKIALPKSIGDSDFKWPTLEELIEIQSTVKNWEVVDWKKDVDSGLWKNKNNQVYIPDVKDIRERILNLGHFGHCGRKATTRTICKLFDWETVQEDIATLVDTCIHCKQAREYPLIRRSLGDQIVGAAPNEVVALDFAYLPPSSTGKHFVLIIKDTYSGFVMLRPVSNADSVSAAKGLMRWISLFGVPKTLLSDRGSHFCGGVMSNLKQTYQLPHRMTFAYVAASNGAVERVNRDFKSLLTSLS
jgi:hypothetical protein